MPTAAQPIHPSKSRGKEEFPSISLVLRDPLYHAPAPTLMLSSSMSREGSSSLASCGSLLDELDAEALDQHRCCRRRSRTSSGKEHSCSGFWEDNPHHNTPSPPAVASRPCHSPPWHQACMPPSAATRPAPSLDTSLALQHTLAFHHSPHLYLSVPLRSSLIAHNRGNLSHSGHLSTALSDASSFTMGPHTLASLNSPHAAAGGSSSAFADSCAGPSSCVITPCLTTSTVLQEEVLEGGKEWGSGGRPSALDVGLGLSNRGGELGRSSRERELGQSMPSAASAESALQSASSLNSHLEVEHTGGMCGMGPQPSLGEGASLAFTPPPCAWAPPAPISTPFSQHPLSAHLFNHTRNRPLRKTSSGGQWRQGLQHQQQEQQGQQQGKQQQQQQQQHRKQSREVQKQECLGQGQGEQQQHQEESQQQQEQERQGQVQGKQQQQQQRLGGQGGCHDDHHHHLSCPSAQECLPARNASCKDTRGERTACQESLPQGSQTIWSSTFKVTRRDSRKEGVEGEEWDMRENPRSTAPAAHPQPPLLQQSSHAARSPRLRRSLSPFSICISTPSGATAAPSSLGP
ncbi:hypothetical protein DUNSADRAFT_8115 [Dunaliella salina]|uniref:Uncharacterized protein n=1 Tax=Dunaliella salina TaxID=3046 RepID=A0ABQ7GK20_DUNSA|nr:hypothetical protein DUNSADRAFT_8115 [Dunaliella salina]|eukprot:KAF5834966.1 hypothetical protein DUNSADRAFT_8115 [Dunaliella salina]